MYGAVGLVMLAPWLALAKDGPTRIIAAAADNDDTKPAIIESQTATMNSAPSSLDETLQSFKEAPWKDFLKSPGVWGILLAHSAKNVGLYTTLAWTPIFYAQQYGVGVKESAWLSVLPSVAGAAGGFVAGAAADAMLRSLEDVSVESKTRVRKAFQAIGLFGPAVALGSLAFFTPDDAGVAQFYLTAAVGLQSFNSAGFEAGAQDKAGPKWAGMLYSVTSLPAVMRKCVLLRLEATIACECLCSNDLLLRSNEPYTVGTFGVWFTGVILDSTQNDWSIIFSLIAGTNVAGALAFLLLFDSKREFD